MRLGHQIRETRPKARTKLYRKKERGFDSRGSGTYSTILQALLSIIAAEMGASRHFLTSLGFDNSYDAVAKAKHMVSTVYPTFKEILLHPFKADYYRSFFYHLRGESVYGFGRSLERALKSLPIYYNTLLTSVEEVEQYTMRLGGNAYLRLNPCSFSSHSIPQWILNTISSSAGLNVGIVAIPREVSAIRTFKKIFPLYLASDHYGYNGTIIYDNARANAFRTVRDQDKAVLRGFVSAIIASRWDSSYPGIGDIISALFGISKVVGVASVEKNLLLRRDWRMPWRIVADREVVISTTRNCIEEVVGDPRARLIDAEMSLDVPQFVLVTGRARLSDLQRAIDETLIPSSVTVLPAPSSASTITATRFVPLEGSISSIERIWNINSKRRYGEPFRLPDKIMARELEPVLPIVDQVADFLQVSREVLLERTEGRPIRPAIYEQEADDTGEQGTVKIRRGRRKK